MVILHTPDYPVFLISTHYSLLTLVLSSSVIIVQYLRCGHCKTLAPHFEQIANIYAGDSKELLIAKIDATEEQELSMKYNIQGYPALLYFPADSAEPDAPYEGIP